MTDVWPLIDGVYFSQILTKFLPAKECASMVPWPMNKCSAQHLSLWHMNKLIEKKCLSMLTTELVIMKRRNTASDCSTVPTKCADEKFPPFCELVSVILVFLPFITTRMKGCGWVCGGFYNMFIFELLNDLTLHFMKKLVFCLQTVQNTVLAFCIGFVKNLISRNSQSIKNMITVPLFGLHAFHLQTHNKILFH